MIQNTLTCCLPTNRWSEIYPVCTWLLNLHVTFWLCSACCIWLICVCIHFPCLWWEWYLLNQATTIFEMGSIYPPKKSWVCGTSFLTLIMLFYSIRFFFKIRNSDLLGNSENIGIFWLHIPDCFALWFLTKQYWGYLDSGILCCVTDDKY